MRVQQRFAVVSYVACMLRLFLWEEYDFNLNLFLNMPL